ncbi:MAG: rhodanese family protein [Phycisphaeraceae bacterium]|nr:rhodanese family protein [Phycisphaeraceae bacterium]
MEATPRQVREWLQSGEAILVDVREPDEHARERIAGARLTPLSRFDPGQLAALAAGGQRIVIHCRSGRRSQDACRLATPLIERGAAIVNMTGGIEAWKKESLPVEGGSGSSMISVMRQVQLVIGVCVLSGSALAWLIDPRFMVIPAFFGAGLIFAGASGTCALATVVGWMPWNRITPRPASCTSDRCGP